MKAWLFVEGESDKIALNALWERWRNDLRGQGWGVEIIPLGDKSRFFKKIGHRAAEKLVANKLDIVVGLPDLYPNAIYAQTVYKHANSQELKAVQERLVKTSLARDFGKAEELAQTMVCDRFFPSALKHDLEMLLLAAVDELRRVFGVNETLQNNWRHPVEEQNQNKPPKRVVEDLFMAKKGRRYRDTTDAPAVLRRVGDLRGLLWNKHGQLECSVFKAILDWIAGKTGVPAYTP